MSPPWMPLGVDDYLADTRHLSTLEHGAYLLLIMRYWQKGGLPDDERMIMRIAGMTQDEWLDSRDVLASFFAEGWRHLRIDAELAKAEEIISKRKGAAKAMHASKNAHAEHMQSTCSDTRVPPLPEQLPEQPSSPPAEVRPPKPALGSFLSPDWQPTPQAMAAAERELGSPEAASRELLKFRNHWLAKAGKDGRKRDWDRTWQNWYLSDIAKRANRHEQQPRHPIQNAFDQAREHAQRMEDSQSAADGWGAGAGRENLLC